MTMMITDHDDEDQEEDDDDDKREVSFAGDGSFIKGRYSLSEVARLVRKQHLLFCLVQDDEHDHENERSTILYYY